MLPKMVHNTFDNGLLSRFSEKFFTYLSPVTFAVIVMLISWIYSYNKRRARMVKLINKIPGPPSLPLIGKYAEKCTHALKSV